MDAQKEILEQKTDLCLSIKENHQSVLSAKDLIELDGMFNFENPDQINPEPISYLSWSGAKNFFLNLIRKN